MALNQLKNLDIFTRNIIVVFAGTALASFLNLLYQLVVAHKLPPPDFAAFNSLLSILMVISTPLLSLQATVIKYAAEFKARGEVKKIQVLLSVFFRKTLILALFTLFTFYFISTYIMGKLKIPSVSSGYILAILVALSWLTPLFLGGLQGLELFKWLITASLISGALKLILVFIFIGLGFNIAGALGAFLISTLILLVISYLPLKNFFSSKIILYNLKDKISNGVNFKEIFLYLFPAAISSFCFAGLVNFDMILVKYFFMPKDSGLYSLAQMVGKIFLFLPGAISIVMFPRTSGLNAKNIDTRYTLKRSLLYASALCAIASLTYNLFPSFIFKILTGKVFSESIILGRLFSISMTFFAFLYILVIYLLSIKELSFIKYLILFTCLQLLAIVLFHKTLIQVQLILCINAILLFFIHLLLAYKKRSAFIKTKN